jgi:tetratricopeptide (TPR) repeat protein
MRRLLLVAALAVVLLGAGAILLRPALAPKSGATPGAGPVVASTTIGESSTKDDVQRAIDAAVQRVARLPEDWVTWAGLGMAYVQQARITADPSYYPRAAEALSRSMAIRPEANAPALTGLGALAAARHDFARALRYGEEATKADPYRAAGYGVVFDALIELGRYDEAAVAGQRMVDLRPDAGSYARASYLFELRGRTGPAREAMELALRVAPGPADAAFANQHLGQLAFDAGDLATAQSHVDEGLRMVPDAPGLRVLRARITAARGGLAEAEAELRAVVDRLPLPEYAAALGELCSARGDAAGAAAAYDLVDAQADLLAAAGVAVDLELIAYAADRAVLDGTRLPDSSVAAARAAYQGRPSVLGADALAWAMHAAGRDREALPYADAALRLGTRGAALHYHRGLIRLALGDKAGARVDLDEALRINPYFSVRHAAAARAALGRV